MKLSDFDYNLPEELIAQTPAKQRDHSRLLVLNRQGDDLKHAKFNQLATFLRPGDLLVFNNSKVFPARLFGTKDITGGRVEILLHHQLDDSHWEVIGKGLKTDARISIDGSCLKAAVISRDDFTYKLFFNLSGEKFFEEIEKVGHIPLPPYIKRKVEDASSKISVNDRDRYQTVYAKARGSVAAPTAGLHFTRELLDSLHAQGIQAAELTLHVGLGTFTPVQAEDITEHKMHREYYSVPLETIRQIEATKKAGGRVIAVGTTTCRVLETIYRDPEKISQSLSRSVSTSQLSGWTRIFIYPPYNFNCIDGLITNFHLPKSSLLMLVSAFAGRDHVFAAYEAAVAQEYRFFSYGDAMLII